MTADTESALQILRDSLPNVEKQISAATIASNMSRLVRFYGFSTWGTASRELTLEDALQISATLACLDVLSQDIAKVPLRLYERIPGGKREVEPGEHWLADFVSDAPNDHHTWYELIQMLMLHLGAVQNAFIARRFDRQGRTTALVPLLPGRVRVLVDETLNTYVYEVYRGTPHEYVQLRDFGNSSDRYLYLLEDEIIHLRARMFDGLFGYSNMAAGARTMGLADELTAYRTRLYRSDGGQRGVFQMDNEKTLSEPAFERLRDQLAESMRMSRETGRPIVLEEGLTFSSISMKATDAEVSASWDQAIVDMARTFRIPPHKIMHLTNVKYENMDTLSKEYVQDALIPYCKSIEPRLGRTLLSRDERARFYLEFDREEMILTDIEKQAAILKTMLGHSAMTVNEARRRRGLNPLPGDIGNALLVPANTRLVSSTDGEVIVDAGGTNAPDSQDPNADSNVDESEGDDTKALSRRDSEIVPLRVIND